MLLKWHTFFGVNLSNRVPNPQNWRKNDKIKQSGISLPANWERGSKTTLVNTPECRLLPNSQQYTRLPYRHTGETVWSSRLVVTLFGVIEISSMLIHDSVLKRHQQHHWQLDIHVECSLSTKWRWRHIGESIQVAMDLTDSAFLIEFPI